jgi:lipopolysaccharide transport system permease protein
LDVRFRLENRSERVWRPGEGISVGWQLYDPATALYIGEGEWIGLERELPPGESRAFSLEIPVPDEPGRYSVYVSPHTEGEGWFYQLNWPFLLVEIAVSAAGATVETAEVTTLGRMRRRNWPRKLKLLLQEPFQSLWRNRRLIGSLVRREITARYRGSAAGLLWTILHPLLMMLTYFFVFGIVMKARFGDDPSRAGFVVYFLAGMLPWLALSDPISRAAGMILENRAFVKKLVFPVETLPVSHAVVGLVTEAFALAVFLVLLVATRQAIPATSIWLPALVVPQFLLTLGVCWFLSAIGVLFRDLGQMIGFGMTLLFFLTPICYPESQLPAWAAGPLSLSPVYALVKGYRMILLENQAPAMGSLAGVWAAALFAFLTGHTYFYRLRRTFADLL